MPSPQRASKPKKPLVLVSTRKGLFVLEADRRRKSWKLKGQHHFGAIIHHTVQDPRDGKTLLAAVRTGHLGPTIFRSLDLGRTWTEAKEPPKYRKANEGEGARSVDHVFWLTPGHPSTPGRWYAGTSPHGLFVTDDGGETWTPVDGFNDHPNLVTWSGGPQDQTPDGPKTHSISVDPRDAKHLYLGLSAGGSFESLDGGASWTPLNQGVAADFNPVPDPEYGHDPHCMVVHPANPDRLYQQNHCGIYRLDRPSKRWERIGKNMPEEIGDVGFPIVVHPRDPDTAWVFPMDGGTVWPRTSIGGKPALYRTRDGGRSWKRQDKGLPKKQAWFTVKRQALAADEGDPVGLYFGTTGGEVWASRDEGKSWDVLAGHLPHVYAVTVARG